MGCLRAWLALLRHTGLAHPNMNLALQQAAQRAAEAANARLLKEKEAEKLRKQEEDIKKGEVIHRDYRLKRESEGSWVYWKIYDNNFAKNWKGHPTAEYRDVEDAMKWVDRQYTLQKDKGKFFKKLP